MMESATLPECLTAVPASPVAFVGLDGAGKHAALWRAFTSERSPERAPLKFFSHQGSLALPNVKPKRSSYEWFIPKGILKTNWMAKHLAQVPAVVVVFFELDWKDPDFHEKELQCAGRVHAVRAALSGRATKIAVVLIQREVSALMTEDHTASDRASALCSACELSARSLFVLPADAENVAGFALRLENAFLELAQNYYHQEIKRIKAHREFLNKTTHLYLFVRHQFKIGFLNELKHDSLSAYKHYQQAYNLLMEVRATDTNITEVKTVAGFINYKICRLGFKLNLPRDAITQFRRHMDIFQHKVGAKELAFEHSGWQSEQCKTFADIFSEAIKFGLSAIQTQHPGLYFQQAAQHAIRRRQLAEELCGNVEDSPYPDPDPLANMDKLEFYGQRPWRPGKVAIEPPDMETERAGIRALRFREKASLADRSEAIVQLLQNAINQLQIFRSPRSESHLMVQMAEELKFAQKYNEALGLLKQVIAQYRQDSWGVLLMSALSLGLKCAFLVASVPDYILFALELAACSLSKDEQRRIMGNLGKMFDLPPKIPSAEPGFNTKAERAAVGMAVDTWGKIIYGGEEGGSSLEDVWLEGQRMETGSLLNVKVSFGCANMQADRTCKVVCLIKNTALTATEDDDAIEEDDDKNAGINLSCIKVFLSSGTNRNGSSARALVWEAKASEDVICVRPGKKAFARKEFEFTPCQSDVGGQVCVDKIMLTLGHPGHFCFNVWFNQAKRLDLNGGDLETGRKPTPLSAIWRDGFKEALFFSPQLRREEILQGDTTDSGKVVVPPSSDDDRLFWQKVPGPDKGFVEVEQRKPLLKMEVLSKPPVLVGEWFRIQVRLCNLEPFDLLAVRVSARLVDASNPLLADTTRLRTSLGNHHLRGEDSLDSMVSPTNFDASEAAIDQGVGSTKDSALFSAPPAVRILDRLAAQGGAIVVPFYLQASTTGLRGVRIDCVYSVNGGTYDCDLTEILNLATVEPFDVESEFVSNRHQEPLRTAYTEEPFLLLPRIRSLSGHAVTICDSWLEVRHPVRLARKMDSSPIGSQLKDCHLFTDSECAECFPLVVKREDLLFSNLDVQELPVGKYIVRWKRSPDEQGLGEEEGGTEETVLAKSTFEVGSVKVGRSSLSVSAELPAFGVVRVPMRLGYVLTNRTDRILEFAVQIEPSDAFKFSGNARLTVKIVPHGSYRLDYILLPESPGEAVRLPRLKLTSLRIAQITEDLSAALNRMLPSTIIVLPKSRSEKNARFSSHSSQLSKPRPQSALTTGPKACSFKVSAPIKLDLRPLEPLKKV